MKQGFKYFFSLIVPIAVVSILLSYKGVSAGADVDIRAIGRPYVINIQNPNGSMRSINGISSATDPFLIARELGAEPYAEDRLVSFPEIKMGIGSKITLRRAPVYYIKDGKKNLVFRSWAPTVGELLAEKKIELGNEDKINFASDYALEDKMNLVIIRVALTNLDEKEPIDYQTVKKPDPNMDEGKTRVEVAGVKGIRTKTFLVRREDGEEVARNLTNNVVTKEPVNEVLWYGTRPVITVKCKFNDMVLDAAVRNGVNANELCTRMMRESSGNPSSDGGKYKGLFQYEAGFWDDVSDKAGFSGASIWDARAQIYTTAWAWAHGYRGRWPAN